METGMTKHVTSFQMTNKMNCFKRFQPEVERFGQAHGLPPKAVFHLTLCLDELVTNIIDYGYADFDEHPIDVTITLEGETVIIRLEDDAAPFNILEAPDPELHLPLEERTKPIGGMGIHLVKNMVDTIQYVRKGGRNILLLHKRICNGCCPTRG
jgi:anti-sigma regulatory factor (Ser/Thr protein kinase)